MAYATRNLQVPVSDYLVPPAHRLLVAQPNQPDERTVEIAVFQVVPNCAADFHFQPLRHSGARFPSAPGIVPRLARCVREKRRRRCVVVSGHGVDQKWSLRKYGRTLAMFRTGPSTMVLEQLDGSL